MYNNYKFLEMALFYNLLFFASFFALFSNSQILISISVKSFKIINVLIHMAMKLAKLVIVLDPLISDPLGPYNNRTPGMKSPLM